MTVEKHLLSTLTLAGYFYVVHHSTEFLCTAHLQHLCTVLCLFLPYHALYYNYSIFLFNEDLSTPTHSALCISLQTLQT